MTADVTFQVVGTPGTKGSKNAVVRGGRAVMYEASGKKLWPWMRAIQGAARHALEGREWQLEGPMRVRLQFFLQRPRTHHTGGDLTLPIKPAAPRVPIAKNRDDLDKLARAALDALTGIAWADDGQVCSLVATKDYGPAWTGCAITVEAG